MATNRSTTLEKKHIKALEALKRNRGNISAACKAVNISRPTFYEWRDNNPEFAQAAEDVREELIDMAEDTLLTMIKEKNVIATLFFLKTQAKSRGYIEAPSVIQVQRNMGDFKEGIDDPTEYISRALDSANVAN